MTRNIETKFFLYRQNNSGGRFDVDDNVSENVIIEAISKEHSLAILKRIIENQSPSCPCCGDRWEFFSTKEIAFEDIKKFPSFSFTNPHTIIHYIYGNTEKLFK